MQVRLAANSLLVGNFIVGVCVVGPAGMLGELAGGLGVSVADIGLLVTYGAVVLCIASPLLSWATSRLDRRLVLAGSLALIALGNLASAIAPTYGALLFVRLVMVAAAAPYTPQAAGAIALLVPSIERAKAIAYVFLGWSLSVAAGLPIVTFLAAHIGWRWSYGVYAAAAALGALLLVSGLPSRLYGAAMSMKSWLEIARNRRIVLILLVTAVQVAGQFAVFTYLGPLLRTLAGAGPNEIAAFFATFGIAGLVGNIIATAIVEGVGALRTSFLFLSSILLGICIWTLGAGALIAMGIGVAFWGLGFAAINSMQQARLVAAGPELAGGSVALNTSMIYFGQAVGSGAGGFLLDRGLPVSIGVVAILFILAAFALLALTRGRGERMFA